VLGSLLLPMGKAQCTQISEAEQVSPQHQQHLYSNAWGNSSSSAHSLDHTGGTDIIGGKPVPYSQKCCLITHLPLVTCDGGQNTLGCMLGFYPHSPHSPQTHISYHLVLLLYLVAKCLDAKVARHNLKRRIERFIKESCCRRAPSPSKRPITMPQQSVSVEGLYASDVRSHIELLIHNLVNIKDETGEFLLRLPDGRVFDTKGWQDWEWTHGIGTR
jgi:hypothetical protein